MMMLHTTSTRLLRSIPVRFFVILATVLGLLAVMSVSFADGGITSISGQWTAPTGSDGSNPPTCLNVNNSSATETVFYGATDAQLDCPPNTSTQSGFGFTGSTVNSFTNGTPFLLGELTHYNQQVFADSLLTGATLNITVNSSDVPMPPITTDVALDETPNNETPCPYGGSNPCADLMSITPNSVQFTDNSI